MGRMLTRQRGSKWKHSHSQERLRASCYKGHDEQLKLQSSVDRVPSGSTKCLARVNSNACEQKFAGESGGRDSSLSRSRGRHAAFPGAAVDFDRLALYILRECMTYSRGLSLVGIGIPAPFLVLVLGLRFEFARLCKCNQVGGTKCLILR